MLGEKLVTYSADHGIASSSPVYLVPLYGLHGTFGSSTGRTHRVELVYRVHSNVVLRRDNSNDFQHAHDKRLSPSWNWRGGSGKSHPRPLLQISRLAIQNETHVRHSSQSDFYGGVVPQVGRLEYHVACGVHAPLVASCGPQRERFSLSRSSVEG